MLIPLLSIETALLVSVLILVLLFILFLFSGGSPLFVFWVFPQVLQLITSPLKDVNRQVGKALSTSQEKSH
ncbi:hypothetical protein BTA51_01450 [Hahella sp. CCB-MM4]|nr:hypothetical protein BTA51_01450 [Hahella sp. CCB-MM4]